MSMRPGTSVRPSKRITLASAGGSPDRTSTIFSPSAIDGLLDVAAAAHVEQAVGGDGDALRGSRGRGADEGEEEQAGFLHGA